MKSTQKKIPLFYYIGMLFILFPVMVLEAQDKPIAGLGIALRFNGSDGYIKVDHQDIQNPRDSNWSILSWVKTTKANCTILKKRHSSGSTDSDFFSLEIIEGKAVFQFSSGNNDTARATGTDAINDDKWHYIAGVRSDPGTANIYIDGIRQGQGKLKNPNTAGSKDINTSDELRIAGGYTNDSFFSGMLDEIQIWNKALSKEQITKFMFLPPKGDEPNLIAFWRCDKNGGDQEVRDHTDNNNHGVANGPVTWEKSSVLDTVTIPINSSFTHTAGYDPGDSPISYVPGETEPINEKPLFDSVAQTITYTPGNDFVGAASYSFQINNNSSNSDECHVTVVVLDIPSVIKQPENDTAAIGDSIKFRVEAKSKSPLFYQWQEKQKDDTNWAYIVNANSSEHTTIAEISDSGILYRCIVGNTSIPPQRDTSESAMAIIGKKPEITSKFPGDTLIKTGQDITLNPSVEGSLPIGYKWIFTPDLKNENPIENDNSSLELKSTSKTNDGYYYFLATNLFGSIRSDTILIRVLDSIQANPLGITGEYYPGSDSARITVNNITKIDRIISSSLVIQVSYSEKFDSLFSSDTLKVSDLMDAGKDRYDQIIHGFGPLPLEKDTVYCQCFIVYKTDMASQINKNQFSIGKDRPQYNGKLNGYSTNIFNKIYLSWNKPDNTPDSIRIWWDTMEQIPLDHKINLPHNQAHYMASLQDTSDTLSGIIRNRDYYFGLQISRNNMWSYITESSRTYVKSGQGNTADNPYNITIDTIRFDNTTNSIIVQWHIDLSEYPENKKLLSGITYSIGKTLDRAVTPSIEDWDTISIEKCTSSIELGGSDIIFDTSYTIGIWIRNYDDSTGLGTPIPPPASTISTIKTPDFSWVEFTLFPDDKNTIDLRNKKITFQQLSRFTTSAVIRHYDLETDLPEGMREVGGMAFRLESKTDELPPFKLGMGFSEKLPEGVLSKNIAIYQIKNNKFYIQHEFETTDSTVWITVTPKSGMLQYPFMILADLSRPKVRIEATSDTVDYESNKDSIATVFTISDNTANAFWRFLYSSGNKSLDNSASDTLDTTHKTINTYINDSKNNVGSIISKTYGVRALFIINDGIYEDTVDVSRCVKSNEGEHISINPGNWMPLSASAHLDTIDLRANFIRSYPGWSYDIKSFRLFRWYPVNQSQKEHWLEYSENNKAHFTFLPGRLIWYKTKLHGFIKLGGGVTITLKQPYNKIELKAKNWTDISNPFAFDIKLRDILKANNDEISKNIDIYHWIPDGTTYTADPVYLGILDFDKIDTLSSIFFANQGFDGYTIRNRGSDSHKLKIPPVCIPLSPANDTLTMSKRSSSNNKWSIDFRWKKRDNSHQSFYKRVRVGYKNNMDKPIKFGILPPSMNKITVGTYDSSNHAIRSWSLQKSMKNGGMIFDIAMHNSSSQDEYIEFYLDNLLFLPEEVKAAILNPDRQEYETPKENNPLGKQFYNDISIPSGSSTHRLLVIGSEEYLNYAKQLLIPTPFSFLNVYPNPFMHGIKILYSIPSGTKEVHFTLYNMMGRQIHRRIEKNFSKQGKYIFYYDSKENPQNGYGPIPSGMYILRLTAVSKENRIMYGGKRRIICIK